MKTLEIRTNNIPRPVLYSWDLPLKCQKEIDFDPSDMDDTRQWVVFKGYPYLLNDFQTTKPGPWNHGLPEEFGNWDGYLSDSYFSGILIRFADEDFETVICATYFS